MRRKEFNGIGRAKLKKSQLDVPFNTKVKAIRRWRFIQEYLSTGNATQAALNAGYSSRSAMEEGYRLLSNAQIQAELATARAAAALRSHINADWVIMQQVALHASTVDRDPDVARKCLRDIGDGIAMYVERHEHDFVQLSLEERNARIAVLLAQGKQRALAAGSSDANDAQDR